jgi:hypothetical protein
MHSLYKSLTTSLTVLAMVFASFLLVISPARADTYVQGLPTKIIRWQPGSDLYATQQGYIYMNSTYYYWGGSTCTGITVPSDTMIGAIIQARAAGQTIYIGYKLVNGYPCVTALSVLY